MGPGKKRENFIFSRPGGWEKEGMMAYGPEKNNDFTDLNRRQYEIERQKLERESRNDKIRYWVRIVVAIICLVVLGYAAHHFYVKGAASFFANFR